MSIILWILSATGEPHSVRLEKRSAENGNPLENAAFQLEVLRDGVYVPYVPADGGGQIRATAVKTGRNP